MASITIPRIFNEKKLSFDNSGDESRGWINLCDDFQTRINRILEEVSAEFFPNYTDHGIKHINNVLKYAAKLIDKRTLEHLDAKSICALIMAILAHDIGMFIPYGGLRVILAEESWAKRWEEYRRELGHMSDSRAQEIFGTYHRGSRNLELPEAAEIVNAENKLIDDDWKKLLCGEFMRRFHHELAEYCVQNGFPLNRENTMQLIKDDEDEQDVREAVALLARSHGEHMDDNDRLIEKTGQTTKASPGFVYGVPIYILMATIRIADYLDAGAERASWIRLAASGTDSKASINEFKWNQFIEINEESIKIKSKCISINVKKKYRNKPITGTTFQRIEHWINSVQREMDISWRYLYLKYEAEEQPYKLSAKMLISNIMENKSRETFAEDIGIVLEPASLSAAPEVLGLLAEPLYGGDPSYGVRELLQNAVDACRARKALDGSDFNGKVFIIVDLKSNKPSIKIIDNGIGMTKEVILQYFLKAGISYQNSDEWNSTYGDKAVIRTGRFGIGVLAAFLLGDKLCVTTLPRGECKGYSFCIKKREYKLIDISIINKDDNEQLSELAGYGGGTYIEIELNEDGKNRLNPKNIQLDLSNYGEPYSWYQLSDPQVVYEVITANNTLNFRPSELYGYLNETDLLELEGDIKTKGSFAFKLKNDTPCANCIYNGFAVENYYFPKEQSSSYTGILSLFPGTIRVTDSTSSNNAAEISINRNLLVLSKETGMQFQVESFLYELAKFMQIVELVGEVDKDKTFNKLIASAVIWRKDYLSKNEDSFDFVFSNRGMLPMIPYLIGNANVDTLLVLDENADFAEELSIPAEFICFADISLCDSYLELFDNICEAIVLQKDYEAIYSIYGYNSYDYTELSDSVLCYRKCGSEFTFPDKLINAVRTDERIIGAIHFGNNALNNISSSDDDFIMKAKSILDEYFSLDTKEKSADPWIPYVISDRVKKFENTFFKADNTMYNKYMSYVEKLGKRTKYYSLDEVEAARKKAEE